MYYIILMEVQGTNLCKLSIYCQISGLILFFNRAHVSSWQFDQENRTLWNLPWASTLTQLWELVESPSLKSLQAGRAGSQEGKLDAKWGRVGANTLELKKRTNWSPHLPLTAFNLSDSSELQEKQKSFGALAQDSRSWGEYLMGAAGRDRLWKPLICGEFQSILRNVRCLFCHLWFSILSRFLCGQT